MARSLRQFQAHFPDLERPSQVQREHLWQWQRHLEQSKAEATVCLALRGMLSLLQWGYHQGYLAKNPAGYCGIGGTGVVCPIGVGVDA